MSEYIQRAARRAKEHFDSMTESERNNWQDANDEEHRVQHTYFRQGYRIEKCYLCGKDFKTVSKEEPCLHWLLRIGKFKPKDIKIIADKYSYRQISAYLRWCANEEKLIANINDMIEEIPEGKVLSSTIRWKNIEWTFDCSNNDLLGHSGKHTNFPHYHFQMRIDGKQFINFNDYHLPFHDIDLLSFELDKQPGIHMDYGLHGAGMQTAMKVDPQLIIDHTSPTDEEGSAFHMSTMVYAPEGGISGELIHDAIEDARKSGRSIASVLHERLKNSDVTVQTVVSPSDSVPEITHRTERDRR